MTTEALELYPTHDYLGMEPLEYLSPSRYGFFSVLEKEGVNGKGTQRSYPLDALLEVIADCHDTGRNYWISQAYFRAYNRCKINLLGIGVNFVDIDYYTVPSLSGMAAEKVLFEYVFPLLEAKKIPLPSLVIDSGRGLQLKWFTENLPAAVLPRWDRLQTELCTFLADLGSDFNSKDASRVLRLQGTRNQKNGRTTQVIWADLDGQFPRRHVFDGLCNAVLPFTRARLDELYTERKEAKEKRLAGYGTKFATKKSGNADIIKILKNRFTLETLNWYRLIDLKMLLELRGGDVGDGLREPMAFYLCNFYALRYAQSGLADMRVWHEFYQICKLVAPHWSHDYAKSKVNNVFGLMKLQAKGQMRQWNGRDVPMLYVPRNETMISLFGITDDEQKQMKTIISGKEKLERATNARREKGEIERSQYVAGKQDEAKARMQKVLMLTSQGFKQAEIAKIMGITVPAVKLLKSRALKARN